MDRVKSDLLNKIAIAALLHDIGKFYQRASDPKEITEKDKEYVCPYNNKKNYYEYQHAAFTSKFYDLNKKIFNIFDDYTQIRELSSMHHNPGSLLQNIIKFSDCASAGVDRAPVEDDYENKQNYKETPLRSIFSLIHFNDAEKIKGKSTNFDNFYGLNDLIPANMDPIENKDGKLVNQEKYKVLFDKFLKDLDILSNIDDALIYESTLIRILEKYLWCIPSATNDGYNDISLFNHSYTTASIATTLYKYLEFELNIKNHDDWIDNRDKEINIKDNFARFLQIDVSGIQKYIFDIKSHKSSSKILRARSLEINLLTKSICWDIINKLNIDQTSVLFEGGGKALILIPNIESLIKLLEQYRYELEDNLFEKYLAEIDYILTLSDPVNLDDFKLENYEMLIKKKLSEKVDEDKMRKFQRILKTGNHVLNDQYKKNIKLLKENEISAICKSCDTRVAVNDEFCNVCDNLQKLGTNIINAKSLIFYNKNGMEGITASSFFPLLNNLIVSFDKNPNEKIGEVLQFYSKEGNGLRFISPYHVPRDWKTNEILTFEDIGKKSPGANKIAMIKGDVNDLGAIFWFGCKGRDTENKKLLSISRYRTLSQMLDYFFTEKLVYIIENLKYSKVMLIDKQVEAEQISDTQSSKLDKENFESIDQFDDKIYVVYAGGDDFTIIGSWDSAIEFAIKLHEEFKKFTANNPYIEFSASIELFNSSTPVPIMAETCEQKLSELKKPENKDKYNVSIFDSFVEWDYFSKSVKYGKQIIRYMNDKIFNRSFIYRLLEYNKMKNDFDNGLHVERNKRVKSLFKYDFSRNIRDKLKSKYKNMDTEKKDEEIEKVENFCWELINGFDLKHLTKGGKIALQYALLATKEKK